MFRIRAFYLFLLLSIGAIAQNEPLFDNTKVEIVPVKQSTDESEFGPFVIGNTIYYSSSQERKVGVITMDASTQHQMLDIYSATLQDSITFTKMKALNDQINTPYNQAGCFFDQATSKLYYTTDVSCENCASKHKLAIFSAIWQNDEFLSPNPELILTDTFTAAHPFVYGNKLYFSSNMPGGKGKTDIYYAEKAPDGWSTAEKWVNYKNCGSINSEEREFFPFVVNENEIYFSSNRPGGLGGLDLYKYTSDGSGSRIQNAGAPMNSEYDDFAIYVDPAQEKGYFSSNREENQDDIYFYRQTWPTFSNCKETVPEDYCYNLSEESTLEKAGGGGFYYEWLFGDGTKQKGLEVRHCFPGPGSYLINLNIIDSLTKSVFMSQATFDLKVDSVVQLKINSLDTVPAHKTFGLNTLWTYLPDNKIDGYYWEVDNKKIRGNEIKHSFSKPGVYKVLLGVVTFNKKTNKKEVLCTTKNIICVNQEKWIAVEDRKFNEELSKYAYKAFKADPNVIGVITDVDIEMFNKMGLNGKKLGNEIKAMIAAKGYKRDVKEVTNLSPGETKFSYTSLRMDTLMRLKEQADITFKVHFGTSKTRKDTSYLSSKGLYGIQEKMIDELYHYTYGNERKISEIEKYYQRSLNAGVKNPVVIGYKNDMIIFDQSANIRPATFEETILNKIKDSIYATAPTNYIETKTNEPALNNIPDNSNQEKVTANKTEPVKTENDNPASSDEKSVTSNEKKTKQVNSDNSSTENKSVSADPSEKKTKQSKEPLIDPNENLNISNEKEFNTLTNVQKKMEYFLEKYGDISVKDLEFRVQVGAFRKRKSYSFPHLAGLGTINNEEHSDGITRMTIGGSFQKLSEAFNFTKKVVNAGQEDAFVSVYYKGKRVYIENLERRGLFTGKEDVNVPLTEIVSGQGSGTVSEPVITTRSGVFEARTNIQKKIVMYAQKYGNISADGLEFKVQIAIFKRRKNYDFPRLNKFGELHVESLGDGVVRITIGGSFKTLGEAFELNKKVVMAGQSDAFVSVFYKGKRIYIENLEHKGIFVVNKN